MADERLNSPEFSGRCECPLSVEIFGAKKMTALRARSCQFAPGTQTRARRIQGRGRSSSIVTTEVQFELVLVNANPLFGAVDHITEMQYLEIGLTQRLSRLGILQFA